MLYISYIIYFNKYMKIISHNINGLRAYINNGKLQKLLDMNADIYCLQEVKISDDKLLNKLLDENGFAGWDCQYSISTFKKGYAGVLTLIKPGLHIVNKHYPENEGIILENLSGYGSGRIVVSEFNDMYLINVYVVNSCGKIEDRYIWDRNLIKYLNSLNKPFILCGDMNVCSTYKDYWGNYEKSIDTCAGLMQFEIDGFKKIINETNSVDIYRMMYPEERDYSYISMGTKILSHGWRLDYFLCSKEIFNNVNDIKIYNNWQKNDHMPIELEIR